MLCNASNNSNVCAAPWAPSKRLGGPQQRQQQHKGNIVSASDAASRCTPGHGHVLCSLRTCSMNLVMLMDTIASGNSWRVLVDSW